MTTIYTARFGHTEESIPGTIELSATSDSSAVIEIRQFVLNGYRNGTWANVQLSDGSVYCCKNEHGEAVGSHV